MLLTFGHLCASQDSTVRICESAYSVPGGAETDSSLIKEVHVPEEHMQHWRVEEEFVGAIRGHNKVTTTDFYAGVRYMEFTEAVTRSTQSGQTVKLPLLP